MKRTKDEILAILQKVLGDRSDDDAIGIIEDISDSFGTTAEAELEKKVADLTKEKTELDKSWREKYKARFFEAKSEPRDEEQNKQNEKPNETVLSDTTLNDIFEGGL